MSHHLYMFRYEQRSIKLPDFPMEFGDGLSLMQEEALQGYIGSILITAISDVFVFSVKCLQTVQPETWTKRIFNIMHIWHRVHYWLWREDALTLTFDMSEIYHIFLLGIICMLLTNSNVTHRWVSQGAIHLIRLQTHAFFHVFYAAVSLFPCFLVFMWRVFVLHRLLMSP